MVELAVSGGLADSLCGGQCRRTPPELDGRRRRAGSYAEKLSAYLLEHGDALGATSASGWSEPAPGARLQARRLAGRHRAHAADHRVPRRRARDALRGGAARPRPARDPHEIDPRLVRGFDYYTSTTFEFLPDRARRRAERRSVAAVATTGWPSRWAASPRPGSGSASASSACSSPARPRACLAGAAPTRRRVRRRRRHGRRHRGHAVGRRSARGRAARRARLRRPLVEGAVEGGRQVRCACTA